MNITRYEIYSKDNDWRMSINFKWGFALKFITGNSLDRSPILIRKDSYRVLSVRQSISTDRFCDYRHSRRDCSKLIRQHDASGNDCRCSGIFCRFGSGRPGTANCRRANPDRVPKTDSVDSRFHHSFTVFQSGINIENSTT